MLLQLDGTVVLQILNFVVFLGMLNFVFLRPVGRALAVRRAHIKAITAEHEEAIRELGVLRSSGEARRLAARRECEEFIAKARAEASGEADTISARAGALAHERTSKAHATVSGEIAAAREREDTLADELAATLLDRALGAAR